jgi:hypothetical protein
MEQNGWISSKWALTETNASEGRHRLLPIPCCSREYRSAANLQTTRESALADHSGSSRSTRKEEVGVTDSGLRQMDTHTPNPASLSSRPLPRHSSFIRAVCIDAHVRICAGGRSVMSVPTATVEVPEAETSDGPQSDRPFRSLHYLSSLNVLRYNLKCSEPLRLARHSEGVQPPYAGDIAGLGQL